jgi:hypothetical protein
MSIDMSGEDKAGSRVFVSKLEELMPADELVFPPTPGFGPWRRWFPEEAVSHPAKANMYLLKFLVENYTRPGGWVVITEELLKQLDKVVEWCECQHGEK